MKCGKRTLKRRAMNARLKKEVGDRLGIKSCEIKLDGCLMDFAMSWAHSRKSRFLVTDEDWMHAALACCYCHDKIEAMSHEAMFKKVSDAIDKRGIVSDS